VWGDYDKDGDLDLFVANRLNEKNFLYANNGNSNSWIDVGCVGIVSNTTGIGTKVRVRAVMNGLPRWQMREVAAQTGYNSQNLNLHFGLGNATVVDSIVIEWPAGGRNIFINRNVNEFIVISENGIITSAGERKAYMSAEFVLFQNYPNPFNPSTTLTYGLSKTGFVSLKVYDVLGREVATLVNQELSVGIFETKFNAANLASGPYFYRLASDGFNKVGKMLLAK